MAIDIHARTITGPSEARFLGLLRKGIAAHAVFFAIVLGYLLTFKVAGLVFPAIVERSGFELAFGILTFSVPLALLALVLFKFCKMAAYDRPEKPTIELWRRVKGTLGNRERMAAGLPMFTALVIFMYVFTMFKANITAFVPFSWDLRFDQWDQFLHFGYRPWEILQPVMGYLPVTLLTNVNYNLWFIIMNVFWVYYAFEVSPGEERTRFFIAFFLIWSLGGSLSAILLSSAGPCYFSRLGLSPDPYADLMTYLRSVNEIVPVWALDTQEMLWAFRLDGSAFGGVSAMPSMHNATTLLFVLMTWRKAPLIRNLLLVHALFIFLGSIHLGWHYAVDSYLAWAVVIPCWFAAIRLARWWEGKPHVQHFNQQTAVGA